MKTLKSYITEALSNTQQLDKKTSKWIGETYDTMQKLIKDNKLKPIDVDVKQLAKPKKDFDFKTFSNDQNVKKILSDRVVGFTVINQMTQMPKKYLVDGDKELNPSCLPYWYRPTSQKNEANDENEEDKIDPTYFVGMVMYDKDTSYVENFMTIDAIETSLCVKEALPLLKAMLNDFALHYINKLGKYDGLASKPMHPKMKANLVRLGFSPMKDQKEILTYKL